MYATASLAVSRGSSEKASKLRPQSGWRCRLTVGARSTRAPLSRAWRATAALASATSPGSQVAPSAVAEGMQIEGVTEKKLSVSPRAPLGPSVNLTEGTPRRGTAARSEEHTSELQSLRHLVCRLLL